MQKRNEHGQAGSRHRSEVDIAGPIEQLDNLRGRLLSEEFQQQKAQVLAKL
jgi:outer membrane receptor for ferric coprogen and ferric-rhodotorulic acid